MGTCSSEAPSPSNPSTCRLKERNPRNRPSASQTTAATTAAPATQYHRRAGRIACTLIVAPPRAASSPPPAEEASPTRPRTLSLPERFSVGRGDGSPATTPFTVVRQGAHTVTLNPWSYPAAALISKPFPSA